MIKINNKIYDNFTYEIFFGICDTGKDKKRTSVIAPTIIFLFENISLELELKCSQSFIKKLKINDKKNLTEYLSDIMYKDDKGWMSLIDSTYQLYIEKIKKNIFKVDFNCRLEDVSILFVEEISIKKVKNYPQG